MFYAQSRCKLESNLTLNGQNEGQLSCALAPRLFTNNATNRTDVKRTKLTGKPTIFFSGVQVSRANNNGTLRTSDTNGLRKRWLFATRFERAVTCQWVFSSCPVLIMPSSERIVKATLFTPETETMIFFDFFKNHPSLTMKKKKTSSIIEHNGSAKLPCSSITWPLVE